MQITNTICEGSVQTTARFWPRSACLS